MGFEDTLREIAFTFVRFFTFSAHAVLFGLPVILLVVLRPAFAGLDESWDAGRSRLAARLEGAARAALLTSAVGSVVGLLLQAIIVSSLRETDLTGSAFEAVFGTTFGQWYLLRGPLIAGLYVLLIGQVTRLALDRARANGVWWSAWIGLSLALLATSSFTGHAAVASPRAIGLVNDIVHLMAGSVWFAGIVLLAVFLPDAWRGVDAGGQLRLLVPTVIRFSVVALTTITIVALTGVLNSFLNVAALDDLVDSTYGRSLSLKLLLFGGVLAMGTVNHFVLRARLEDARVTGTGTRAPMTFRKTIAVELVIGLGIMAMTGILTGQPKTRNVSPEPTSQTAVVSE